jgi:hypothetical protein
MATRTSFLLGLLLPALTSAAWVWRNDTLYSSPDPAYRAVILPGAVVRVQLHADGADLRIINGFRNRVNIRVNVNGTTVFDEVLPGTESNYCTVSLRNVVIIWLVLVYC